MLEGVVYWTAKLFSISQVEQQYSERATEWSRKVKLRKTCVPRSQVNDSSPFVCVSTWVSTRSAAWTRVTHSIFCLCLAVRFFRDVSAPIFPGDVGFFSAAGRAVLVCFFRSVSSIECSSAVLGLFCRVSAAGVGSSGKVSASAAVIAPSFIDSFAFFFIRFLCDFEYGETGIALSASSACHRICQDGLN